MSDMPRTRLPILMHNALYDASIPAEPPAPGAPGGEPATDATAPSALPAHLLAVLVNIETAPRTPPTCGYSIPVPGFGLATCAHPAAAYVTSEPCGHGAYACARHRDAHVEAVATATPGDRVVCLQCKPHALVSHITYTNLEGHA